MVSRRRILSRSRDELHFGPSSHLSLAANAADDEEEDVWHSKEKLYRVSAFRRKMSQEWKHFWCGATRARFLAVSQKKNEAPAAWLSRHDNALNV